MPLSDKLAIFTSLLVAQALLPWCDAHPEHPLPEPRAGAILVTETILNQHPYLLEPEDRMSLASSIPSEPTIESNASLENRLVTLLESVQATIEVTLEGNAGTEPPMAVPIALPGDRGGIFFKVSNGEGPVHFTTSRADLALTEGWVSLPVASSGTTWSFLSLENVPDGITSLFASFEQEGISLGAVQFQVTAPAPGRLIVTVLSDDTGKPTPSMVQLKWLHDGSLRPPVNAIDFAPQFDSQAADRTRSDGSRLLNLPGIPEGDHWVVPGPIDMMLPPGQWQISILRGLEHLPVMDTLLIQPGNTVEAVYQPERWVHMAAKGWYSGDDHVHARVMSQRDADNLLSWALAEDLQVVNLLEMGDHARTYFQQRAFGQAGRITLPGTLLVPGQEDPRIGQLGHTIALNIDGPVRDTSRYYLHDWVHDRVHELGGVYGYAHVNREMFQIHRDMTLNVPLGKVDFVELLQFHQLGTRLFYDFLNLGFKATASAGSDVPWGATIGEVRVYAFVGGGEDPADGWFRALEKGRTFVTNGPMIEFSIDDALPGDEIPLREQNQTVRVKARAWGHPDRAMPTRLEIVSQGEVIKTAIQSSTTASELQLEFDLEPGPGCWVAARAFAGDGSAAHTTPVYLVFEPFRFWNHPEVPELIAERMASLEEVEQLIAVTGMPEAAGDEDSVIAGTLAGAWYGNVDFTRPQGIDTLHLPRQTWLVGGERGGAWSAQWKGAMTLPVDAPARIILYLDSTGPSTLNLNGHNLINKLTAGEESAAVELRPGFLNEFNLTYVNHRTPKSELSLSWSADGIQKQPVPREWFSLRDEDRTAFRFAEGTQLEATQLSNQAEPLRERVARARLFYEALESRWLDEAGQRRGN